MGTNLSRMNPGNRWIMGTRTQCHREGEAADGRSGTRYWIGSAQVALKRHSTAWNDPLDSIPAMVARARDGKRSQRWEATTNKNSGADGWHVIVKEHMMARMRDGASVHEYGVKMIRLIEKLVNLDLVIPHDLSADIILLSLPSSFDNFVVNFNMKKLEATLEELGNILANYEATMKKEKSIFLVSSSSGSKKEPKKNRNKCFDPIKKIKPNKKPRPTKPNQSEHVYFHYNKLGHWRCNCKESLAEKRSGKALISIESSPSLSSSDRRPICHSPLSIATHSRSHPDASLSLAPPRATSAPPLRQAPVSINYHCLAPEQPHPLHGSQALDPISHILPHDQFPLRLCALVLLSIHPFSLSSW
ncbi:hypothetical protein ZIOFF_021974 [Zingiber officinale]|uniref:Gag-pol polyprotein n=1 Tax=Zingiber officinale TaxID=94328 RepID=A0A8J5H2E9_ZINOF|nr:hypothetical protein ZIOFF_021974 [Zingiber officinale]